ncbi:hypothetical protein FACS189494_01170 [Spirochaetia bacterium]|nr:hypothetical protein FACS189494_01170 [Spirochaetia bacterium]
MAQCTYYNAGFCNLARAPCNSYLYDDRDWVKCDRIRNNNAHRFSFFGYTSSASIDWNAVRKGDCFSAICVAIGAVIGFLSGDSIGLVQGAVIGLLGSLPLGLLIDFFKH